MLIIYAIKKNEFVFFNNKFFIKPFSKTNKWKKMIKNNNKSNCFSKG